MQVWSFLWMSIVMKVKPMLFSQLWSYVFVQQTMILDFLKPNDMDQNAHNGMLYFFLLKTSICVENFFHSSALDTWQQVELHIAGFILPQNHMWCHGIQIAICCTLLLLHTLCT